MREPLRLMLDMDGGIESAIALLFALLSPDIAVEGVTTVRGETSAAAAAEQALRLAALAAPGRELPTAAGADTPPRGGPAAAQAAGRGSLGGALLPPAEREPPRESAAELAARLAGERPGELAYVFAARATNWPLALARDPRLAARLRAVAVAGGAVLAPGDATPVAEANFRADPEAAAALLQTAPQATAVGLDASAKLAVGTDALARLAPLVPAPRARAFALLRRLVDYRVRHPLHESAPLGLAPLPGVAALLALSAPEHFAFRVWPATVAAEGELASGMVVADRRPRPSLEAQPVRFAMDIDAEAALRAFLSAWTR